MSVEVLSGIISGHRMDVLKRSGGGGWVKLSVGGKVFSTTRATLCRLPDTMLARMFRDDAPMEPSYLDESGAYLIDLDPAYFGPILNYLRFDKLVIDANVSPLGVLETARFLNLTDLVNMLECGSVDPSYLQYIEIAFVPSTNMTTVSGSIDLCAKDLTANLGFVRYGESFQKSGQHALLVLNTLSSKGWTVSPNGGAILLMSFRLTPAAPSSKLEKRVLSSLHLSDPLGYRASISLSSADRPSPPVPTAIPPRQNMSPPPQATGSGKKIFP